MGVDATRPSARDRLRAARSAIPLLAEVLAELGGRVAINVELKLDFPRWWPADVGTVVARTIADAGTPTLDRVIVTSFDPRKLRAARRVRHDLAIGFCFDDNMLAAIAPVLDRVLPEAPRAPAGDARPGHHARRLLGRILESALRRSPAAVPRSSAPSTRSSAPTPCARLHARGVAIGTHTLFPIGSTTGKRIAHDRRAYRGRYDRLVALGVDWIETDNPERLLGLIG